MQSHRASPKAAQADKKRHSFNVSLTMHNLKSTSKKHNNMKNNELLKQNKTIAFQYADWHTSCS